MDRLRIRSGAPWESIVAYSRAIRIGDHVHVSGTTALRNGSLVGEDDAYLQAQQCLANINHALESAGARMTDVTRTRIYVTDIDLWEDVGRAHREAFADIMPATSMVEISRLIDPAMLVEIEADAYVSE
ncbi:MAG: RidA family protein [Gammaproteobacteria bacterium]|nr:MAG: RidA family protein [Gammaproteobacteria bacterium]